jgi:serine/threonine-protein kinase
MNSNFLSGDERVREILIRYIDRRGAGEAVSLEDLCGEHPTLANELRELVPLADSLLEHVSSSPAATLTERLTVLFGRVDPRVELEDEDAARSEFSSEVLARLAGRGLASTRYRLKGEVAHGGMGTVLRVWDEDLRRHLAMKVILGKGARKESPTIAARSLSRFLEEAQVTGQLEHPGIVPVHELGLDTEGRVYFTMKLVKGRTLKTVFAELRDGEGGWTQIRVLGLVLKVCEAMSYAHAKGVIHRDLKPANVMVGQFGEVYVMDWGLARVLSRKDEKDIRVRPESSTASVVYTDRRDHEGDTPDSPLYTMDGDVVGTPAYMSPEQAQGRIDDVGPASDVYALGAMLYHLLAGHPPYVPPGARLGNYAVLYQVQLGPPPSLHELAPRAPVELVAICEKAMAREIARRYPDTSALAEDLTAYVEGRVVRAHATGAWAEARKWVRRNRELASAIAAGVLILIVGLIASSSLYVRAEGNAQRALEKEREARQLEQSAQDSARIAQEQERSAANERDRANAEAEASRQVVEFLARLLSLPDPHQSLGAAITARDVLDEGARMVQQELADQPAVQARLMHAMGSVYANLGELEEARNLAEGAYEILAPLHPEGHRDVAESLVLRASVAYMSSGYRESEELTREALAMQRTLLGDRHEDVATSLQTLAIALKVQDRVDEAVEAYRETLAIRRERLGPEHALTISTLTSLGEALRTRGELEEAEALHREALAAVRKLHDLHPELGPCLNNLALVLQERREYAEAERLLREALDVHRRLYGERNAQTGDSLNNLAALLAVTGQLDEAEALHREALEIRRTVLEPSHADLATSLNNLGLLLQRKGQEAEAEELLREAIEIVRQTMGNEHSRLGTSLYNLGKLLYEEHEYAAAAEALDEALPIVQRSLGAEHWRLGRLHGYLGESLAETGQLEAAGTHLARSLEILRAARGPDHEETVRAAALLEAHLKRTSGL